jgi:hypothetical protein
VDTAKDVLIWIGVALAAGFVGYFGRHLAMMIIDKISRKKPEPPPPEAPPTTPLPPSDVAAATQAKVDKKRAKAETKKAKKEGKG